MGIELVISMAREALVAQNATVAQQMRPSGEIFRLGEVRLTPRPRRRCGVYFGACRSAEDGG